MKAPSEVVTVAVRRAPRSAMRMLRLVVSRLAYGLIMAAAVLILGACFRVFPAVIDDHFYSFGE